MPAETHPRRLVVTHLLGGRERGGIVTHLLSLARHLDPNEFALTAILFRGGLEAQLAAAGFETELLAKRGRGDPTLVLRLARRLRRTRPDLVHTHSVTSNLYGRLAARIGGSLPVVTTVHGFVGDILRQNPGVPRLAAASLARLDLRMSGLCRRLIAVSQSIAADLLSRGVAPAKVVAIPNGVEAARFQVAPDVGKQVRQTLGLPTSASVIGTVGSLVPLRNHALLLEAAKIVSAAAPETRFVIVGEGSEGPRLRAMAQQLGLTDRVVFAGERSDIPELLSAFDVFALSCDTEGFGLAALEAMAAGLPIVATRVGALPELIVSGESGLLAPPRDAQALAAALLEVLRNRALATQLGQAARLRAETNYSAARSAARVAEVYREALAPPRPRAPAAGEGRDRG